MKKWTSFLLAFLLLALAVTPAFADGPFDGNAFRYDYYPFRFWDGMALGFVHSVITALALAALGMLIVVFLPQQAKQIRDTASNAILPSMGVGCLTLLVALPLTLLLVVLIVTIPAAVLVPIALAAAWTLGWIALGWYFGEKILDALKAQESLRVPVIAVAVGTLLLALLSAVPLIGGLFGLVVGLIGLGAVVLTRFGTRAYPILTPAPSPNDTNKPAQV